MSAPLLSQSEEELGRWREALSGALGPNGQLMVNLVPELELVIGKQPPVAELPPQDAQNRFQMVFRRFLGVFARKEHPLALFLDDLQWLDAATLDLLAHLVTHPEVRHLLLVGAYRDNEISPAHPLLRTLDAIRKAGTRVQEISLAPLAPRDLSRLIADTLGCTPDGAAPLARLVHEKTGGNPFFAIQFISALAEEGLLRFDHEAVRWRWELDRVSRQGVHRQCGGPYGREVDPPARQDPGGVAAARLPRQRRRDHDAFDRFREIERGRPFGPLERRSSGAGRAFGELIQVHPTTGCRKPLIPSYRKGRAPRRTCASDGCSRRISLRRNAKRPSSKSSISSTAARL